MGCLLIIRKKSLMEDFCLAYKKILEKHELYATGTTGRRIEESDKASCTQISAGGASEEGKQFVEMIARNEMDMVIFFYNPLLNSPKEPSIDAICRACDNYNVPDSDQYSYGGISASLVWQTAVWNGENKYDDQ